jgi:hypothetical protein
MTVLYFLGPLFLRNLGARFLLGGGCNTPGVTVADTVHLQFLYSVSTVVAMV